MNKKYILYFTNWLAYVKSLSCFEPLMSVNNLSLIYGSWDEVFCCTRTCMHLLGLAWSCGRAMTQLDSFTHHSQIFIPE